MEQKTFNNQSVINDYSSPINDQNDNFISSREY